MHFDYLVLARIEQCSNRLASFDVACDAIALYVTFEDRFTKQVLCTTCGACVLALTGSQWHVSKVKTWHLEVRRPTLNTVIPPPAPANTRGSYTVLHSSVAKMR